MAASDNMSSIEGGDGLDLPTPNVNDEVGEEPMEGTIQEEGEAVSESPIPHSPTLKESPEGKDGQSRKHRNSSEHRHHHRRHHHSSGRRRHKRSTSYEENPEEFEGSDEEQRGLERLRSDSASESQLDQAVTEKSEKSSRRKHHSKRKSSRSSNSQSRRSHRGADYLSDMKEPPGVTSFGNEEGQYSGRSTSKSKKESPGSAVSLDESGEAEDGEILEDGELDDDDDDDGTEQMGGVYENPGDLSDAVRQDERVSPSKSSSKEENRSEKMDRKRSEHKDRKKKDEKGKRKKYVDVDGVEGDKSIPAWGSGFQGARPKGSMYENKPKGGKQYNRHGRSANRHHSPPGLYDSPSYSEDSEEDMPKSMIPDGYVDASVAADEKEGIFKSNVSLRKKKDKHFEYRKRGRDPSSGKMDGPPKKKALNDLAMSERPVCKFYMEGKCAKGTGCQFNHDVERPKRMEVCMYHLTVKGCHKEQCQYMHEDFPCKYYHTGAKCYSGDRCKFSHDPLTEETRRALEMRVAAEDIIDMDDPDYGYDYRDDYGPHDHGGVGRPSLLGSPPQRHRRDRGDGKKIPSLFEIEVHPPGQSPKPSPQARPSGFYNETNSSPQPGSGGVGGQGPGPNPPGGGGAPMNNPNMGMANNGGPGGPNMPGQQQQQQQQPGMINSSAGSNPNMGGPGLLQAPMGRGPNNGGMMGGPNNSMMGGPGNNAGNMMGGPNNSNNMMGGPNNSNMMGGPNNSNNMMGGPNNSNNMMGGPNNSNNMMGGPNNSMMGGPNNNNSMMGGPNNNMMGGPNNNMMGGPNNNNMMGGPNNGNMMGGNRPNMMGQGMPQRPQQRPGGGPAVQFMTPGSNQQQQQQQPQQGGQLPPVLNMLGAIIREAANTMQKGSSGPMGNMNYNNNSSNSNNNMGPGGPNNMRPRMMGNGGVPPNSMGMGPGGMNQGMGPNNMGQGMGPMNQNMGPGNMNQGMGPGNVNQGLGAGGLNQNMGPGGPNQNMGPGGMNQNMGPGNMNRNMGPGGMNQNMAPGGMNQGMGPAGMNQNVGPGGMNQNMVPGSTILPPSEPGSATATSTNNSMGGPRPPPVSAGQEVGFMDMDYRIKPDFDGDGRVEQRMNTGETNEMGDTDHRVKEKEVTEEDEDDEENSKDLKELDKIRQQIQAQIDNASDGEEEEEEEGENEDEEMAEDGSVLPKKEELSPERMDESGQEIKDEKAAIKAEVEAEMANIEVPAHLPKKQRELFIRIQQQQLMREKEKEKQEAAKAAEDSEVKEEAADDWYSSDEEGDNQKAPNLTDVLKKLSKDTLPVSSSEGSVVKQEVPDTSSASAAPATTSTGSMFNIMQMINAIKKQSSTSSAKLPTDTITSTQAPGSPKSPTDSEGKPFQLPSALLQQLPALTVDPPVVSARPLNPLKYAVVKIALNMPKPYTQLPKGVNASDPSYKSDPRVKWYLQYLEKQLQSAPKEVVRRPSVDTEKPSKPVDPRLKKVPTDPRLAKAAADSGSGDVSRPTDPRLQRAQAQGRPTDPRLARQAGANLDPRLNRQNSQDPMGNMGMMGGQMSSPMAGSGGVMNTGGMGMGGPMNNMNSMGNMMGGMPNSMAGGMNSGMNNMGRPMNNQMGGPMNNPMGGPGMMGGPGPMNNPMGGPGPMNNQRGSPAMNNQMGGPAMNNPMGGGSMNNMMGGGPMNVMKSRMNNPMRPFQGGPVNAPMGGPMGNNMNRMGNPMNPMGGPMNAMGGPIGGNQNMNRMGGPQGPGGGMGGPGPVGPQGIMGSDSGDRRMAGDFHNPSDPRLGGGQRPPNDPRVKIKASEPNKNDPRTNRRDPRMGPVSMDESDSDIRMLSSDPSSGSKSNNLQRPGGSFSNSSKDFSQSGNFPPPPLPDPMMDLPIGDADLRLGLGTPPTSSSSSTPPPDSMQDFDSDLPKPAQKFDHRNDPRFKRVKRSTSQLKNSVEYNSPLGSAEEVMVSEEGDGSQFSNYNKPRFPPGKDPRSRNVPSPSLPDTLHDFEAQGPPPPMEAEPALKVKDLFKTIDPTASPFC